LDDAFGEYLMVAPDEEPGVESLGVVAEEELDEYFRVGGAS
jgi:hypothetical protein